MTLQFPNQSRAFDETRRAVRFWGHDGPLEVLFFVGEDALKPIAPASPPGCSMPSMRTADACTRPPYASMNAVGAAPMT
jgi:hypothetical protein